MKVMKEIGVVASPIYSVDDMLVDETFNERESFATIEVEGLGPVRMQNVFPKLANHSGTIWRAAPKLGSDNDLVYGEFIGKGGDEVERLKAAGTI